MTRTRGRPVIPMPTHPERVISRVVKAGLSATIELQRNISNKVTREYYDRSRNRFSVRQQAYQITKKRGSPDFSHISKAEAQIRDDTRLMLYENAAKYGFIELSRQKNADDTIGPLNQRLNVCGGVVRENSEIMFPMPHPVSFGTYTRRDGKGKKKYRRAGYEGSSFGPKVILAHPDLPSLDFGDAVRSHNEYLATFCAIHNVPVRETTRYSHLFYLLVRPYLEYLYSEFEYGKSNFQKGVNWALRQVKELVLEAGYPPTMHEERTVTAESHLGISPAEENWRFFKRQETEARDFYDDHPAVAELNRLRGNLGEDQSAADEENEKSKEVSRQEDDSTFLTVKDVEYIRNEAAKRARIAGSIMHRRIADLFPSPWHLNDVILSGDRYEHSSDYIIISEVPLQTAYGAGKVDLILCERAVSDDGKRVFWKPVFVIEIKTHLGQSWYIEADYKESEVRPAGSALQRIVSEFPLRNYPLSDDLWGVILRVTPTPIAQRQLDIYCQALTSSYENTTQEELGRVLRGVLVIEASSDVSEIRRIVERVIVHGYESLRNRVRRLRRTVFTPSKSDNYRIALVVDEQPGPKRKGERAIQASWEPTYTPFKSRKRSKRKFMLYLAGHSPTSAGQSAAWNARYFHGLQMLCGMKQAQEKAEFVWIDLANQFDEPRLAEARLRLRPRGYSEEEMAKVQPDHIREFFESIKVKGYLDDALSFLYRNGAAPSFGLKTGKKKRKVIIVTGVDTLRDATPSSHMERFGILIDHLLASLPENEKATVVWFDSPVPSVEKATPYSTRALLPYHETSSLREVVTEIVWNLPIAPRGAVQPEKWGLPIVGDFPMHDDIRVIVRHTQDDLNIELTHVPLLRGWSKRFKNKGIGPVTRKRDFDDIVPEKALRNRMKLLSLATLPWLVRLQPHKIILDGSVETLEEQIAEIEKEFHRRKEPLSFTRRILEGPPIKPPSLLELVRFRLPDTMDALAYQKKTAGKINSQRLYRSPRKLQTRSFQRVPVPRITEEGEVIEEELEYEWLFGIKFESESDDPVPWWMVIQDPSQPSRTLIGCFTNRLPDKNGFLWTESKQELMTQTSLDEILGFSQTVMIGRNIGEGLELWSSRDDEDAVFEGVLELKKQGRSTIGFLRAIRQTIAREPATRPTFATRPPESFYRRIVDSLRRYLAAVASPTPVSIHLEMVEDICHVILQNEDGEAIQNITFEYTADLISLLRWPMVRGGPMFTDSGIYATWSVFDDIAFGGLDFLRPYVSFRAARSAPEELPKRIAQFFDYAETIPVGIEHDHSICPLALDEATSHGECWRITLPHDCSERVRRQLGKPMTGEDVNGFLSPERLYAGKLYLLEISLPDVSVKDESIVFHEDRYIRMFLRSRGCFLKRLEPGTYLRVSDQKWTVEITWEGSSYLRWSAWSTVSGLPFTGSNHTIALLHGCSIDEEYGRIMGTITSEISEKRIANRPELEAGLRSGLKNIGYSRVSPPCEIRVIESTKTAFIFGVYPVEAFQREPLMRLSIDATGKESPNSLIEMIEAAMSDGDMSYYSIRNKESFMKKLTTWVNRYVPVKEDTIQEPEEWEVTLSANMKKHEINWEAKQYLIKAHRTGLLYDDKKILLKRDIRGAIKYVREIVEGDLIPELGRISNLEEVLNIQVPEVIRELRRIESAK
ncbi:MAG: hypothetical protein ACFFER_00910 [Candidatus Thorarchaeota archaeon]